MRLMRNSMTQTPWNHHTLICKYKAKHIPNKDSFYGWRKMECQIISMSIIFLIIHIYLFRYCFYDDTDPEV